MQQGHGLRIAIRVIDLVLEMPVFSMTKVSDETAAAIWTLARAGETSIKVRHEVSSVNPEPVLDGVYEGCCHGPHSAAQPAVSAGSL